MKSIKTNQRPWRGYTLSQLQEQSRLNKNQIEATKQRVDERFREMSTPSGLAIVALQIGLFAFNCVKGRFKTAERVSSAGKLLSNVLKKKKK